ncbi:MAG: oligoendopeptidase F, partial [Bradyrhizobium sp.]
MTSRSTSALRRSTAQRKTSSKKVARPRAEKLPEWNLSDLYSGIGAPEVARDLDRLDAECVAFENDYKGKLAERTAGGGGGRWLAGAVKRFEAIDDLAGRLGSYAG